MNLKVLRLENQKWPRNQQSLIKVQTEIKMGKVVTKNMIDIRAVITKNIADMTIIGRTKDRILI